MNANALKQAYLEIKLRERLRQTILANKRLLDANNELVRENKILQERLSQVKTTNHLRSLVDSEKQRVIGQLLHAGIYKMYDGRDLYEGTLYELQKELQHANKVEEVR